MKANDILRRIVLPTKEQDVGEAFFAQCQAYVERETLVLLKRRFGSISNAYGQRFLYHLDKQGVIIGELVPFDAAVFNRAMDRL